MKIVVNLDKNHFSSQEELVKLDGNGKKRSGNYEVEKARGGGMEKTLQQRSLSVLSCAAFHVCLPPMVTELFYNSVNY